MGIRVRKPEDELQHQVIKAAQLRGWRVAHFRKVRVQRRDGSVYWETPVQADGAGFPDLVLVKGKVLWVELKADDGRLSPEQVAWLERLRAAGQEAFIWRPADWPTIERVLSDG
jgi:VRR-NUC domain